MNSPSEVFRPVSCSLRDLLGGEYMDAVVEARSIFIPGSKAEMEKLSSRRVDFLPPTFLSRLKSLHESVGTKVGNWSDLKSSTGASSIKFNAVTNTGKAPVNGFGYYRMGEDGRLYLTTKSEHYHTSLGHGFPGYELVEMARQLGIPNATHNNTRGAITRLAEEKLICAAAGVGHQDLNLVRNSGNPEVLNRVFNLQTGSLAVEAALKLILARFYCVEPGMPEPLFAGRTPVFLILGDKDGNLSGNYHGTTVLTQLLRGMWPEILVMMEKAGMLRVCAIRPNNINDLETAFGYYEENPYKIAGFFHEIVMMNYGALLLEKEFLHRAYQLCQVADVPTVADEIQSCAWNPGLFLFRVYGLTPDMVAVGKGFPGGEYASSRLLFNSRFDVLPQFGALVTNGQEELASLTYLITMRWVEENGEAIKAIGIYYEQKLWDLVQRYPGILKSLAGHRHLSALVFEDLVTAKQVVSEMNTRGFDISVQSYKADCPPVVLTKLPLISDHSVADLFIDSFNETLKTI